MGKAVTVETLEELNATAAALSSAVWHMQMLIAAALEQQRVYADDVPPAAIYEAAAQGALLDEMPCEPDDRAWSEQDERDYVETMRVCR